MSETINAARKLITKRLGELEVEAARLEQALKGMGEGNRSLPKARKPQRKRVAGKPRRPRRAQAPRG